MATGNKSSFPEPRVSTIKARSCIRGDILKQTERMLENIDTLLQEAGGGLQDIMQAIVYLRDPADYVVVKQYIESRYPSFLHLIVHAPVCRPGWLIETECIAVVPADAPQYACL